ncbi:MAG: terminase small subunit [Candidatus Kapaibacterium sp.]
MATDRALTAKQARFCTEYTVRLNATAAAIRAGYSAKTAEQIGYQLLQKTSVQKRITELQKGRLKRVQVKADDVVRELARLGFSDIRQLIEWGEGGTTLRDSSTISDESAATISEISSVTTTMTTDAGEISTTRTRLKLHSKIAALKLLAEHLGMLDGDAGDDEEESVPQPKTIRYHRAPEEPAPEDGDDGE